MKIKKELVILQRKFWRSESLLKGIPGWGLRILSILIIALITASILFPVLWFLYPPYPESQISEEFLHESFENKTDLHYSYTVHDPTYTEMKKFLEEDKADQNEYILDEYMCHHFSKDLVREAAKKGIRAGYVRLDFPEQLCFKEKNYYSGHAIVCFNTTDKGLIFIEPQFDLGVTIKIGGSYQEGIVSKNLLRRVPLFFFFFKKELKPLGSGVFGDYDDTVEKLSINWNGKPSKVKAEKNGFGTSLKKQSK